MKTYIIVYSFNEMSNSIDNESVLTARNKNDSHKSHWATVARHRRAHTVWHFKTDKIKLLNMFKYAYLDVKTNKTKTNKRPKVVIMVTFRMGLPLVRKRHMWRGKGTWVPRCRWCPSSCLGGVHKGTQVTIINQAAHLCFTHLLHILYSMYF